VPESARPEGEEEGTLDLDKEAVMKRTGVAAAVVVLLVTVASGSSRSLAPAEQGKSGGNGADAIKAVADAYVKAALAGDAKGVAALYADDAIEMPPNVPMIKGRAAIQQYYEKEFGSGTTMNSFTLTHLDTYAMGDRGYDVGTYRQSVTPKGMTTALNDTGKYTVILKRSAGTWQIASAIYNSDQAPAAGK
jgi:uncharacterized protein (TIGR02246 family)